MQEPGSASDSDPSANSDCTRQAIRTGCVPVLVYAHSTHRPGDRFAYGEFAIRSQSAGIEPGRVGSCPAGR